MLGPFEEVVSGTIIGDITYPYEFWVKEERPEYQTKQGEPHRRVDRGLFADDDEAKEWFEKKYPEEAIGGFEMRVFDLDQLQVIQ